eukprot:gene13930-18450_t
MIVGPSGAGKSDLALRLIDRGAVLVSDDYTECAVSDGALLASAPSTIAGKIEMRGLGIVDMPHAGPTAVAMVVTLADTGERMPERGTTRIAGVERCLIAIDAFEASAPIKRASDDQRPQGYPPRHRHVGGFAQPKITRFYNFKARFTVKNRRMFSALFTIIATVAKKSKISHFGNIIKLSTQTFLDSKNIKLMKTN